MLMLYKYLVLKVFSLTASITTLLVQSRKLSQRPRSKIWKIKPQVSGESRGWTQFLSLCSFLQLVYLSDFLRKVWSKEKAREKSSLAAYMTGGKGWRCGNVLAMTSPASSWLTLLLSLCITDSSEGLCCSPASLLLSQAFPKHRHNLGITSKTKLWAGLAQRGTPKQWSVGTGRDVALMGSTTAPLQLQRD